MHQVPKKKQGKDYTRLVMHIPKPWYEHLDVLKINIRMFFVVGEAGAGVQNGHVKLVGDTVDGRNPAPVGMYKTL